MKKTYIIIAVLLLLVGGTALFAQPSISQVNVAPPAITVGTPTDVTFTASVTGPIPLSVNLIRLRDGASPVIVGQMKDDGTGGDAVAGDGVFSSRLSLAEATTGQLRFQASAAFRGLLQRRLSPEIYLPALPPSIPDGAYAPPSPHSIVSTSGGSQLAVNELLITLKETVPNQQQAIDSLVSRFGGLLVGQDRELSTYQVRFSTKSYEELMNLVTTIEADPAVDFVTRSFIPKSSLAPPNDPRFDTWDELNPSGNNWGFELM